MSETAWAHLPNAKVIDEVIADFIERPQTRGDAEAQVAAWCAAWGAAQVAARVAVQDVAWDSALDATWAVAWDSARYEVQTAARDALLALIAWDSSADLLSLTPDALRTIIDTCDGDVKHQAVLLLPAVIARSTV